MEQPPRQEAVNMTEALEALSPWLKNPRRTVIQAEAFTAAIAVLLLLQLLLGSYRRQSRCFAVHAGTWLAYTLPSPLIAYTLGLMQSSPVKYALYPVWAASLVLASAGTNAVKAYQLDDNNQWLRSLFDSIQYFFYGSSITGLLVPTKKYFDLDYYRHPFDFKRAQQYQSPPATKLSLLVSLAFYHSKAFSSFLVALGYWDRRVAKYMKKRQARRTGGGPNPGTMLGYQYPIRFNLLNELFSQIYYFVNLLPSAIRRIYLLMSERTISYPCDAITIEKIWQCEDPSLPKDVCLAYSLYELLKLRYYGMTCPEKHHGEIRRLILEGLLPTGDGYERAFGIVEAELGFCHDYFFTKYPVIFKAEPISFCLFLMRVILLILVLVDVLKNSISVKTTRAIIRVHTATTDSIITLAILSILLLIEVLQAVLYVTSDWFKVSAACCYVRLTTCCQGNACLEKLIRGLIRIPKLRSYWQNRIGQYSIISYSTCCTAYIGDASKLNEVKMAVADCLKSRQGQVTNGKNGELGQYQDWEGESDTDVMLICIVATEYCDIAQTNGQQVNGTNPNEQEETEFNRDISVILSRYCAYLMGSAPELLPGYFGDTKFAIFDLQDAASRIAFSPNKYQAMKNYLGSHTGDHTIFKKGLELGDKLVGMTNSDHWKMMADFWTEKILYIAPSENVKGHMELLAKGGEFLTHIWVLLTHADILKINREIVNREQGQSSMPNQAPTPEINA